MGQITATRNLVATKVVRHAGQWYCLNTKFKCPSLTMEIDGSIPEGGLIENHPFYKCIQPLLIIQKAAGGWIHRPCSTSDGKSRHNAFFMYCLFWVFLTMWVILKSVFFITWNVSLQTSNMYIYLQVSTFVGVGVHQIMSDFKYRTILPFGDNSLFQCPQELSGTPGRSKIIIRMMVII